VNSMDKCSGLYQRKKTANKNVMKEITLNTNA